MTTQHDSKTVIIIFTGMKYIASDGKLGFTHISVRCIFRCVNSVETANIFSRVGHLPEIHADDVMISSRSCVVLS